MARHNGIEMVTGAAVLVAAVGFLAFAVTHTGAHISKGYQLHANFDHVDGLSPGADVRIAGVKVGSVDNITLDTSNYQAVVHFTVAQNVPLTVDSSASIASDSLLGGKYMELVSGGDDKMLHQGGQITITQGSVNLESLIGKYIFGSTGGSGGAGKSGGAK